MLDVAIIDPHSHVRARVTSLGQLVVAPSAYDDSKFLVLDLANTVYSFFPPIPGKQFVVTGIRGKADRDVSNTVDAEVVIYEAASVSELTVVKTIHQEAMIRGESFTLLPMNKLVSAGSWVNAKTTDDDIHMSIFGYYINEIG